MINYDLLVAAPMLQDVLIDKTGIPMASGTITCYQDDSRTILKNWYYQSGTPGNYTYITLPNPLTLSAAGTICDINGVDTIPFFYPYSETDNKTSQPYYITIVNYQQTNQITRANFPYLAGMGNAPSTNSLFDNIIVNNGFWRNILPNTVNQVPPNSYELDNAAGEISVVIAPSQHDGFRYPDILFFRSNATSTDSITFIPFPLSNAQPIMNYIVPEYYINHSCTGAGTGVTQKCYQFPISLHLNTLANVPFTVSIQAQAVSGSTTNVMTLYLLQDTGTGTTSPDPIFLETITLDTTWTNYSIASAFPGTLGLVIGNGADDAWYLQVQMPVTSDPICSINFTKPSLYLTADFVPFNDFQTYDQVDAIINSPRTGDIRTSLNSFYNYGWVPMNDGTLGNYSSNATAYAQQDGFPLFNLIWQSFKSYDSGGVNPIAQMYSSAGSAIAYGSSAISDWSSNNAISLTKMMGRVILGDVPMEILLPATSTINGYTSIVTFSSSTGLLATTQSSNLIPVFYGMPVIFSNSGGALPTGVSANTIYYVTANSVAGGATTFNISTSFVLAMAGTAIAYTDAGSGTTTVSLAVSGTVEGEYAHNMLLNEMVNHTHNTLSGTSGFWNNTGVGYAAPGAGASMISSVTTGTITGYGSKLPFNVTQPGTFYNMFIKL